MKGKYYLIAAMMLTTFVSASSESDESTLNEFDIQTISYSYYETPYRLLANKDPSGMSIEMDDGAIWRIVDYSSAEEVKYWRINDPLIIQPTLFPNWSGARYFILNERLGSTATAEISYGPLLGRATHNQIVYIDYMSGMIQLQDGIGRTSFWKLSYADRAYFQQWRLGQTIIIGSNEDCYAGWFSSDSYILINVERNDFVNASIN